LVVIDEIVAVEEYLVALGRAEFCLKAADPRPKNQQGSPD